MQMSFEDEVKMIQAKWTAKAIREDLADKYPNPENSLSSENPGDPRCTP